MCLWIIYTYLALFSVPFQFTMLYPYQISCSIESEEPIYALLPQVSHVWSHSGPAHALPLGLLVR